MGGWVSPLGDSLNGGRLGRGVSKGGTPRRGASGTTLCAILAGRLASLPGRAGAERAHQPAAVSTSDAYPWGAHGTQAH